MATSTFGELNTCAGYTPPGNNRVVYQFMASPFGIHHPEITGLYTIKCRTLNLRSGIHHPEITGLYTGGLYVTIGEDNVQSLHTFSKNVSEKLGNSLPSSSHKGWEILEK